VTPSSRACPTPQWLEHWLSQQIKFDAEWETKVVERILHNMGLLMNQSFATVQELNRFRKQLMNALAASPADRVQAA